MASIRADTGKVEYALMRHDAVGRRSRNRDPVYQSLFLDSGCTVSWGLGDHGFLLMLCQLCCKGVRYNTSFGDERDVR